MLLLPRIYVDRALPVRTGDTNGRPWTIHPHSAGLSLPRDDGTYGPLLDRFEFVAAEPISYRPGNYYLHPSCFVVGPNERKRPVLVLQRNLTLMPAEEVEA